MARLAFFATKKDYLAILDFLFGSTDCCVYELDSEFEKPIRKFSTIAEVEQCFIPGRKSGSLLPTHLRLWSPSAFSEPVIERISLKPESCQGYKFRYVFRGPGSAVFHFGGISEREIEYSEYNHFDEPTGQASPHNDGIDWPVFRKLSARIQYHIRGRLAVAKLPGHCILPDAMEQAKEGCILLRHQLLRWKHVGGNLIQCVEGP